MSNNEFLGPSHRMTCPSTLEGVIDLIEGFKLGRQAIGDFVTAAILDKVKDALKEEIENIISGMAALSEEIHDSGDEFDIDDLMITDIQNYNESEGDGNDGK